MCNSLRLLGMALLVLLSVLTGGGLTWLAWEPAPKRERPWLSCPALDESRAMARRSETREAITRQVVAKEMGLFDAAAWFLCLNDTAGERQRLYQENLPGGSDAEKACRHVIVWVGMHLKDRMRSPEEVDATVRALERELEDHIARHGKVMLPEGQ